MRHPAKTPAIARIWPRVDRRGPDECWPPNAPLSKRGRWIVDAGPGEKSGNATRFILEEKLGRPLHPGHGACHTCDWPPCCNPAHLWEGTPAQNAADRNAKGRAARGERHGRTKLSDEQIRAIRSYPASPKETARVFGISHGYVSKLRSFHYRAAA